MNEKINVLEVSEDDIQKLKNQIPYTVKRRMVILGSIKQELNRRNFKQLDETNKQDLERVSQIISDMYPETNERKLTEYARVSIRMWKREKQQ